MAAPTETAERLDTSPAEFEVLCSQLLRTFRKLRERNDQLLQYAHDTTTKYHELLIEHEAVEAVAGEKKEQLERIPYLEIQSANLGAEIEKLILDRDCVAQEQQVAIARAEVAEEKLERLRKEYDTSERLDPPTKRPRTRRR